MRQCGMTRIFANPGSTEVAFLNRLPDDLGVHPGSARRVGRGHGHRSCHRHERAGPFVGLHHRWTRKQCHRRTGDDSGSTGSHSLSSSDSRTDATWPSSPFSQASSTSSPDRIPSGVDQPVIAPGRSRHGAPRVAPGAAQSRGPAIVIVPMDDWAAQTDPALGLAAPLRLVQGQTGLLTGAQPRLPDRSARSPAPSSNRPVQAPTMRGTPGQPSFRQSSWAARCKQGVVRRARVPLRTTHSSRSAFGLPLPAAISVVRTTWRWCVRTRGLPLNTPSRRGSRPTDLASWSYATSPTTSTRSAADLASPHGSGDAVPRCWQPRRAASSNGSRRHDRRRCRRRAGRSRCAQAAQVFAALARLLPPDTVLVEETPSSRQDLHRLVPARAPRGFVSAAMGAPGSACPRRVTCTLIEDTTRPVVARVTH